MLRLVVEGSAACHGCFTPYGITSIKWPTCVVRHGSRSAPRGALCRRERAAKTQQTGDRAQTRDAMAEGSTASLQQWLAQEAYAVRARLELFDPQTADLDMPLPPLGRVGGGARGELEWLRRAEWVSHRTRVRWSGSDDALKKAWTQQLQTSRRPCGGGPSSSRRAFGAAIRRRRCCAAAGGVPTTTQSGWCATARRKWRTRMGARWSFS